MTQRARILFVQKIEGLAGSETYYLNILPELVRRGFDVEFLNVVRVRDLENIQGFIEKLRAAGVKASVIHYGLGLSLPLLKAIRKHIERGGYDLVQSNLIHADVWLALVKRLWLPKLLLVSMKHGYDEKFQTTHGFDPAKLRMDLFAILTRFAATQADRVVSISHGLRRLLVEGQLVPEEKALVIPYGFDFKAAPSELEPGAARFGHPQLVIVGRLVPVKQHRLILEALPRLIAAHPKLSLVLVGNGPLENELKALAEAVGVSDHVVFTGFRRNAHDYIRDSDALILPSSSEGFGAVILEAWHNSKPVIAFDVPAPNEIITHGRDGILVEPNRPEELEAQLISALSDPVRLSGMGMAGLETYRTQYTLDKMVDATTALYGSLLSGRSGH
jgi:glycosyltransferase involved in cell wall biosynthesis